MTLTVVLEDSPTLVSNRLPLLFLPLVCTKTCTHTTRRMFGLGNSCHQNMPRRRPVAADKFEASTIVLGTHDVDFVTSKVTSEAIRAPTVHSAPVRMFAANTPRPATHRLSPSGSATI